MADETKRRETENRVKFFEDQKLTSNDFIEKFRPIYVEKEGIADYLSHRVKGRRARKLKTCCGSWSIFLLLWWL